jgi:hypothetical protein
MNTTQIKWNTDKPKFEDVENKMTLVWWEDAQKIIHTDILNNYGEDAFESNFKGMIKWTILTDEPVYCEWVNKIGYYQGCISQWEDDYKFCPDCGNPILIVEVKPMALDGWNVEINQLSYNFYEWRYEKASTVYASGGYKSRDEAITAWNAFCERMKK